MAKVTLVSWSARTEQETTKDFKIPGGTQEIKVQGDWLVCHNPNKQEMVYFRLGPNIKRVEVQYD